MFTISLVFHKIILIINDKYFQKINQYHIHASSHFTIAITITSVHCSLRISISLSLISNLYVFSYLELAVLFLKESR